MKKHFKKYKSHYIVLTLVAVAMGTAFYASNQPKKIEVVNPPVVQQVSHPSPKSDCDESLWDHVYHGRFKTAQDRLKVIEPCKIVTGTIVNAKSEADGDFHIRFDVDDKSLLNAKNISGQHGYLVVETVCQNPISQRDTKEEGVCDGFSQNIFNKSMIGQRATIIGAYVTDMEHSWNEIHPVTSIIVGK